MKKTVLFALVFTLVLVTEQAKADFTFGTPTNLGPTVNTTDGETGPSISADGLSLYFSGVWPPFRPGGHGAADLWVTTRSTEHDLWGTPGNLGAIVNSSAYDLEPSISTNGLSLYFCSNRPGGYGGVDIWVTTREKSDSDWGTPVNFGSTVNTSFDEAEPSISFDGLTLFFDSNRPDGSGGFDIYMTTRMTMDGDWTQPVNVGPEVNSSAWDNCPSISGDGLALFFCSRRLGTSSDLWMTTRTTSFDPWRAPVHLQPNVNSMADEATPDVSFDGRTLFFKSERSGGFGSHDLWQVSIDPVVDLNGDGIVDAADMCIMIDHWGTDNQMCDIGPMPWGDGIVDVQDLIILAEHLFEVYPSAETVEVNEDNDGGQIELELGRILVVTLESNPSTGYRWELVENNESILKQFGQSEFKPSETSDPPMVGAGGWEIFRFKAVSAGQMTLKLVYHRSWEEGVEPLKTFSIQIVVP